MDLKVSKENTGKQSNHSVVSKRFVSQALSNIINNKIERWESLTLTSFQKPHSQSVFVVFRIVHSWRWPCFFTNLPAFHEQIVSFSFLQPRERDNLQVKNKKVCNKTTSTSASFLFKGRGTKQTTVKWPFKTGLLLYLLETSFVIRHLRNEKETREESGPKLNWAKTPGNVTWD